MDELTDRMYYEHKKHDGSLPILGVNTFLPPQDQNGGRGETGECELMRSSKAEKDQQVTMSKPFATRMPKKLSPG